MNKMQNIRIEKISLNVGAGKDQAKLEKGLKLLKNITGMDPVKTVTRKRIPTWGLRPGLPIGCKITLRGKKYEELLDRLLQAKDKQLTLRNVDGNTISFGIHEYIDIPGVEYDPDIKIAGLEVCVTLERPGYRIKRRRYLRTPVPKKHMITKEEAVAFLQSRFEVKVEAE